MAPDPQELARESTLRGMDVSAWQVEAREFADVGFAGGDVTRVAASASRWPGAEVSDARIIDSNFSNTLFDDCRMQRVEVTESRLVGASFAGGHLRDLVMEGCLADMSSWRSASLTRAVFRHCRLDGSDWAAARFSDIVFVDCTLVGAQFSQCRVQRVRFASCDLAGVGGLSSLAGALMGLADVVSLAPQLAGEVGIVVNDPAPGEAAALTVGHRNSRPRP